MGYDVERDAVPARAGLRIHTFGPRGDVIDEGNHFRDAYGVASGDWVLVRPDGYVAAIVASDETQALADYLSKVGLGTRIGCSPSYSCPKRYDPFRNTDLDGRDEKKGRAMTTALDGAREKLMTSLFADWDKQEIADLARLLRKLADGALAFVQAERSRSL